MAKFTTFSKEFEDKLNKTAKEYIELIQSVRDSTDDAHMKSLGFSMQQDFRHLLKLMRIAREYVGLLRGSIYGYDDEQMDFYRLSSQQKMKIAVSLVEKQIDDGRVNNSGNT